MDAKLAKDVVDFIITPLPHILNIYIVKGIEPSELKIAKIVPIYKAKDPAYFTHYRPISIFPASSNMLEKLAYNIFIK